MQDLRVRKVANRLESKVKDSEMAFQDMKRPICAWFSVVRRIRVIDFVPQALSKSTRMYVTRVGTGSRW
jgi:hypothetical protein